MTLVQYYLTTGGVTYILSVVIALFQNFSKGDFEFVAKTIVFSIPVAIFWPVMLVITVVYWLASAIQKMSEL